MKALLVVGTRPQLIKLASLVRAFVRDNIQYEIVHTGQHYDYEMDYAFFEELDISEPIVNLKIGSGLHGWQTGMMLMKIEEVYQQLKPALVIVPGDTNSALAGGLAAIKMGIHVAHVEAGLRSGLPFMAEEINRVMLDHLSQLLCAPTNAAYNNLLHEGISNQAIHLTGDVMADNIILFERKIDRVSLPVDMDSKSYVYVTLHRSENVDDSEKLNVLVEELIKIPKQHDLKLVFPVHPHTRKRLEEYSLYNKLNGAEGIHLLKPVSYLTSLGLVKNSAMVLTDSGGLQKESFILKKVVITLREVTEWVETVQCGWNILVGVDPFKINKAVKQFINVKPQPVDALKLYGNGRASERISKMIVKYLE